MSARKILFVPLMVRGHIGFLIGVLQRLQGEGHELACCAREGADNGAALAAQIADAGVRVRWLPDVPTAASRGTPAARAALLQTLDPATELRWYRANIERRLHPDRIQELRRAIQTFRPDVVCVDTLMYSGGVAAELEGVPWATLTINLVSLVPSGWPSRAVEMANAVAPELVAKMRAFGAKDVGLCVAEAVSPWLNVRFHTEEFLPRSLSPDRTSTLVGPSRPLGRRGDEVAFPWDKLRSEVPVVYVSGGGGHGFSFDLETFAQIAASLREDEAQFVFVLHDLVDDPRMRALPPHVVAVRYAPQLRLLEERVSLVVTHGGSNTVTEALSHGRPMLVVPIGYEQDLVGRAVEACGAGLMTTLDEVRRGGCRDALLRLIRDEPFRRAAARVGASYATRDGAGKAVELILQLAAQRQPLMPSPA